MVFKHQKDTPTNVSKMNHTVCNFKFLLYFMLMSIVIGLTPQYLSAQTYQQETATINRLIISAKSNRFSDSATALRQAHFALSLAQKYHNSQLIYASYNCIGKIYDDNCQDQKANQYFIQELTVEHQIDDNLKKMMYTDIGNSYLYLGELPKFYDYSKKLYQLGLDTKDIATQQISNLQLGVFYTEVDDFEKASQYLMRSVELSMNMNNPDQICYSYRMLMLLYFRAKNHDLALQCGEKVLAFIDKTQNQVEPRYRFYGTYGNVLRMNKMYQKAIEVYNKAANLCEIEGDKSSLSRTYIQLATTYNEMNDLAKAEFFYHKSATFITSMSAFDVNDLKNSMGILYLKKGDYDAAITHFEQSLTICTQLGNRALMLNNYEKLSQAFENKGNDAQSLFYLKKSVRLKDSIFSEENTKRVADAQFKYNLAKSEQQLNTMQQRQVYAITIGLFITLLLFVAFLVYYSRNKNDNNNILADKNNEIKGKNRQLEESNEILRQFAYASAHDLKEPLRSINSFVNILQKKYMKDVPTEAHEYMGFVTTGVKRMESLLNALLEFSSVLSNEYIESKKNEVLPLLKTVFYNHQNLINDKQAVIRYPSVFPAIFMGDTHLKLLFCNLTSNALKFSKTDAKIEISYKITSEEFILSVKDEGIGIDELYNDKVFKLFQRLDRVTHKESAGVGLTICKNIVDKYSGRIWFDSVLNKGTTFYIAFPKSMISDVPTTKEPSQYFEHVAAKLSAAIS
jgi:signal transduction histidine kinase